MRRWISIPSSFPASARSQIAAAFLRKYGDDRFEAYSAGLEPKDINPYTVRVMEEAGLSLDGQYSKSPVEYMGKVHLGYMITVVGSEEDTLSKFREIRGQIDERIKGSGAELDGAAWQPWRRLIKE